jgi:hypothetical protein
MEVTQEGKTSHDVSKNTEKNFDVEADAAPAYSADEIGSIDEIHRTRELQNRVGFLRNMRRMEEWIDSKIGIELQGVDRIPEDAKTPPSIWNAFFFWWSLNVHVGVIPLGVLAPELGLSLRQSLAASILGTILGALVCLTVLEHFNTFFFANIHQCTSFTGTLGPKVYLPNQLVKPS